MGLKIVIVEGCEIFGGICFNVGCILFKVFLYVIYMLYEVEYSFVNMGLKGKSFLVDWK